MIKELLDEIEADEGRVMHVYMCPAGKPTFGVGHMIRSDDPEVDLQLGDPVSERRVQWVFEHDVADALKDCRSLYKNFNDLPEEVQKILGNMMFNLGLPRLSRFVKLRAAVLGRDWKEAALQMEDSLWFRQLPERSTRLINRMRRVGEVG